MPEHVRVDEGMLARLPRRAKALPKLLGVIGPPRSETTAVLNLGFRPVQNRTNVHVRGSSGKCPSMRGHKQRPRLPRDTGRFRRECNNSAQDGPREKSMTKFTRRTMLVGTAAAAAAAANPRSIVAPARAVAPTAGKQAPGFYRYKVGSYEITVVTDGARSFPLPDTFVTNVKKDDVNAALEAAHLPRDMMTLVFNPVVVNTGSKLVAIDTGYGAAEAKPNTTHGQYQQNLAAAGIDAKAIDTVIISHYHPDHVNGLLGADDKPAFSNAEILVPAAEHKFWMDDGEMSRASPGRMQGLFKDNRRVMSGEILKRTATYEWGKEIAPGITSVSTPGHTPGHTSYVIASGSARLFVF